MSVFKSYMGGVQFANQAKQGQQQATAFAQASQRQNKLAAMMENPEFVSGLMSGDANALAGYAAATGDPSKALAMQKAYLQTQGAGLQNDAIKQDMSLQRQEFELAVKEQAATMSAQQRKEAANKTRQAVQAGMTVQSPEHWDQMVTSLGQPDLVGKFEQREGIMATYLDAADIMERYDEQNAEPEPYKPMSSPGKVQADINAGVLPEGTSLRGEGLTVNNNMGGGLPGLSKLGEGYTYLYDSNGQVRLDGQGRPMAAPIPGGPKDKSAAAANAAENSAAGAANVLDVIGELRQAVLDSPGTVTGVGGSIMRRLPGTSAYDAEATSSTVKANLAFDALAAMRAASPTGGALGAVSERELALLESQIANLDLNQSDEKVLRSLDTIEQQYTRILQKAYKTGDGTALDAALGGRPPFITGGATLVGENPYIGMSDADFGQLDIGSLSPEEIDMLLEARK